MHIRCGRRIKSIVAMALLGLGVFGSSTQISPRSVGVVVAAETQDFSEKIAALKVKFPHGKYWNHVGSSADNSDGYTEIPCTEHKTAGISHVYGTGGCTCNHFTGGGIHMMATQCMGFANKLGYDVFGDTGWVRTNNPVLVSDIVVGDIVRIDNDSHSVFVISKVGSMITVGEANYPNSCRINWDRQIDLSQTKVTYYEHAANYDSVMAGQVISPVTTEIFKEGVASQETPEDQEVTSGSQNSTTGFVLAEDGEHYYYLKNGVRQKGKWITVSKKKYYLDENGYRVTGFYAIGIYTYYFEDNGELRRTRWFDVGKKSYYSNEDGIVLKSQWLYKDGVKVYVTKDGSVARSKLVKIGSNTYYFNSKGKRSAGFKKYKGKYYYSNKKGVIQKKKWISKSGKKYYVKGNGVRAQAQLLKIGKYKYYFNESGQMLKKQKVTYDGIVYKVDKYGHCKLLKQ